MMRIHLYSCLLAAVANVAFAADGQAIAKSPTTPAAGIASANYMVNTTEEVVVNPIVARPSEILQPHTDQNQFLHTIEDLESKFGPYDASLSEQLVGLGTSYQQQGDHELAIEAFKRAMHIHRVHEGLYNMNQVPIFERLIESHISRGEWEEANDRYQHLYWLHKRNFGNDDPRMLPVINKLSSWHLNAFTLNGGGYADHLINANNLYRMAVEIIDENYGTDDLRLIEALRGITLSNYYLATFTVDQANRAPTMTVSTSSSMSSTAEQRDKLNQYIQNSYYTGKNAINRMLEVYQHNPAAQPGSTVKAQVELGDWYMLFNRPQSALDEYRQAYASASELSAEELKALFNKPVVLPAMPLLETKVIDNNQPHAYVVVTFDVSPYGKATNIEIIDSHPEDNARIRSKVRQSLKYAKFRPRIVDGEIVSTEKITHRYIFPE